MTGPIYLGVAITMGLSCAWDLRTRRIPNVLTFGSAAAALTVRTVEGGGSGLAVALTGSLIGVLLFLPWFLAGGMGGGDVKLLGAFGAWLGPPLTFRAGLYAMAAGGIMAAIVLMRANGRAAPSSPSPGAVTRFSKKTGAAIAYAVPTAAGVGLALWLQ